jgi:hypothetical protein
MRRAIYLIIQLTSQVHNLVKWEIESDCRSRAFSQPQDFSLEMKLNMF